MSLQIQSLKVDSWFIFSFWDAAQLAYAAKKWQATVLSPLPSYGLGQVTIDLVDLVPWEPLPPLFTLSASLATATVNMAMLACVSTIICMICSVNRGLE
jgi:hypothetical protein